MSIKDDLFAMRQQALAEDIKKMGGKSIKYRRKAFSNFQNSLALYSDENVFKRHVSEDYDRLSDDADFQNVLAEVTKSEQPGMFAFFRGVYLFRHIFHRLRNQQLQFAHQTRADKKRMEASPNA
jgi:hypothetical protein